nr:family 43 glycosylhydrolase [Oscillospiraceae bacterium]
IDPSLYFEDGRTFFISNGADDDGTAGVVQCEINIETGEKLSRSKTIWKGSGGRYLESPHMYKINGGYYLMAAEGGTEYGHMITYARGDSVWGEFNGYAQNPVLTNRNKAPYIIQGIGHGDLIQDQNGDWHILCLGFRQIGIWQPFHNLGREVFLVPVTFDEDGWFTAGYDGTCDESYEIKGDFEQVLKTEYTFENTAWDIDWCKLRKPIDGNYELSEDKAILYGTDITLDDTDSPTFIAMRQRDFCFEMSCNVSVDDRAEGGVTVYMSERAHYDIAVRNGEDGYEAVLKINIGCVKHIQCILPISSPNAEIIVRGENYSYKFFVRKDGEDSENYLGCGDTKYLSSEVDEGFTGVMLGIYSVHGRAEFTDYKCIYK